MFGWLLVGSALAVSNPTEVADPRASEHWVTDQAGVLPDDVELALNEQLQGIYRDKGAEVAVVTLDAVEGDADAFAQDLFRIWGLGSRNRDRGVLLMVAVGSENLSLITGIGLSSDLPQGWNGQMQMDVLVPKLAEGDIGGALTAGVAAISERIQPLPRVPETYTAPEEDEGGVLDAIPLPILASVVLIAVIGLVFAGLRLMSTGGEDDLGDDLPPRP